MDEQKVDAWRVEFEDGTVELWPAEQIDGVPAFGRWITPLVAAREPYDRSPDLEDVGPDAICQPLA